MSSARRTAGWARSLRAIAVQWLAVQSLVMPLGCSRGDRAAGEAVEAQAAAEWEARHASGSKVATAHEALEEEEAGGYGSAPERDAKKPEAPGAPPAVDEVTALPASAPAEPAAAAPAQAEELYLPDSGATLSGELRRAMKPMDLPQNGEGFQQGGRGTLGGLAGDEGQSDGPAFAAPVGGMAFRGSGSGGGGEGEGRIGGNVDRQLAQGQFETAKVAALEAERTRSESAAAARVTAGDDGKWDARGGGKWGAANANQPAPELVAQPVGNTATTTPAPVVAPDKALGWRDDGASEDPAPGYFGAKGLAQPEGKEVVKVTEQEKALRGHGEVVSGLLKADERDGDGVRDAMDNGEPEDADQRATVDTRRPHRGAASQNDLTPSGDDFGLAGEDEGRDTSGLELPPPAFLPDMFYFENTYLGGDAGYRESLRRLDSALSEVGAPHRLARLPSQGFDAPEHDGMNLVASADRTSLDGPGRVFLQVGLRGSERFGWRRPPLELVAVIDGPELDGDVEAAQALVSALLNKLGPQDRLAVIVAGEDAPLASLESLRHQRSDLLPRLERDLDSLPAEGSLPAALTQAGWMLAEANKHRTTAPGTQVVLLLTSAHANVPAAAPFVSQLTLGGIVTSVIGVGPDEDAGQLWQLAAAGHGNVHTARVAADEPQDEVAADNAAAEALSAVGAAVDSELDLLARVVARLLRVNVKLAPGVKVVRVLGSRPLLDEEVRVVKAREVETDRRLSQVLGIQADRGDDDDGVQTVIPVFYGGDAHVVVLELWAEGPGPIADVTLRYKDMVNLENRAARTSVALRGSARVATAVERAVSRNRQAFEASEQLSAAAAAVRRNDLQTAAALLTGARSTAGRSFVGLLSRVQMGQLDPSLLAESLELAARRAVGGGA